MSHPLNHRTTVVLVDPTSDDGETSLGALHDDDTHVEVVVLLSGKASAALHEYSQHEQLDLADAGWNYLDQVAARIDRPGRTVGTIVATGPDTTYELAMIAADHDVDRIVLPSSIVRLDRATPDRLGRLVSARIDMPLEAA